MSWRAGAIVLAVALVLTGGCGGPPGGPRTIPRDPREPYVITAIDYHFHDAHPTDRLALGRELIVSNQGRNIHNVTIPGTNVVRDIEPGERISFGRAGALFGTPGRHEIVCRYHVDRGMTGVVVVAG